MKKILFLLMVALYSLSAIAQQTYWVRLTDKQGTTFDPYAYFDAKAIERYNTFGADLYDSTNYPLNAHYYSTIEGMVVEAVGTSRWLNAVGVVATEQQVAEIMNLPFVKEVMPIDGGMPLAQYGEVQDNDFEVDFVLSNQLIRMQGQLFRFHNFDGKGVRIAVLDGGFPKVDTHEAFRHLRENNQIVKTWNFCNKKEDVYGWNSHGTMTLSCIGGRIDGMDLGLATAAEYLLARTEVNTEPFKEEIWWMQGMEWADKNGANIISSSLGYGKERHTTAEMDGTSYVAKAGNIAARKGMLVCNSAGNEADSRQWKTIITPADADSVLCVGGINNSLEEYMRTSFSSYGPSADLRQKPNVVAFGWATAASPKTDTKTETVAGTSFSCPLVAGFAACAYQATKPTNIMHFFHEIERSADLYPYHDYTYGYGVPQADYFVGERKEIEPTFTLTRENNSIVITPTRELKNAYLFTAFMQPNGFIDHYSQRHFSSLDTNAKISFKSAALNGHRLLVHLAGYTDSIEMNSTTIPSTLSDDALYNVASISGTAMPQKANNVTTIKTMTPSKWGDNSHVGYDFYVGYGITPHTLNDELSVRYSDAWSIGMRFTHRITQCYRLGWGIEYGGQTYRFDKSNVNGLDGEIFGSAADNTLKHTTSKKVHDSRWSVELFQRIRFVSGGQVSGRGLYWDLGVFGALNTYRYILEQNNNTDIDSYESSKLQLYHVNALDKNRFSAGVVMRFGYSVINVYAKYRLTGGFNDDQKIQLPRLETGIMLAF